MSETTEVTASVEASVEVDARKLYSRMTRRLIPYLFLLYILAYLDRVNVGFAALEMKHDLMLTDKVYGLAAAIFFLGYMLFDLPSNLLLQKVGARRWIAWMMIVWGVIAAAMAFVTGERSFDTLRFFLGISEAGFFPGIILYLTYWFPSGERARAVAKFITATSIAGVIGAPLSHWLLKMEGLAGFHGWQLLFLSEGIPTVLVGFSVLYLLGNGPQDAKWLSAAEKAWLDAELTRDRAATGAAERHKLSDAFKMPMVWVLAAIYFISQIGVYAVNLWMPLLLHNVMPPTAGNATATAQASATVALYAGIPYVMGAIFTVIMGWSSDRTRERRGHVAVCMATGAVGFTLAAYAHSLPAMLVAMCFAAIGYWSMMGAFWALPTAALGGRAAAGGVSVIMIAGGLGGYFGGDLLGRIHDYTHSFAAGELAIAGLTVVSVLLCFVLPGREKGW